ncbi:unnamed protein product [Rhodiola kirilowii]
MTDKSAKRFKTILHWLQSDTPSNVVKSEHQEKDIVNVSVESDKRSLSPSLLIPSEEDQNERMEEDEVYDITSLERAFSSMNIIKSKLRNKMNDEFLDDLMILYVERTFADCISDDDVISAFEMSGPRRVKFS